MQAEWNQPPIWAIWRRDKCLPLVGNGNTIPQPATSSLVIIPSGILWRCIALYQLFSTVFTKHFQKSNYQTHVCPSVFLHGKRRLPPDRFSLNTLFEIFGKVCRHTPILVVKGHTIWRPTYVYDISLLLDSMYETTFSMLCEMMSKRKSTIWTKTPR